MSSLHNILLMRICRQVGDDLSLERRASPSAFSNPVTKEDGAIRYLHHFIASWRGGMLWFWRSDSVIPAMENWSRWQRSHTTVGESIPLSCCLNHCMPMGSFWLSPKSNKQEGCLRMSCYGSHSEVYLTSSSLGKRQTFKDKTRI